MNTIPKTKQTYFKNKSSIQKQVSFKATIPEIYAGMNYIIKKYCPAGYYGGNDKKLNELIESISAHTQNLHSFKALHTIQEGMKSIKNAPKKFDFMLEENTIKVPDSIKHLDAPFGPWGMRYLTLEKLKEKFLNKDLFNIKLFLDELNEYLPSSLKLPKTDRITLVKSDKPSGLSKLLKNIKDWI